MAPLVLLTGATGLVGFRVLQELLKKSDFDVRIAVRSEEKAQTVFSNPVIQKLQPTLGGRLTYKIVPDSVVPGAFDEVLQEVTYVIHAGSPVPVPGCNPLEQVWKPTVLAIENLLASAAKVPTIKRVLVTSSIVANMAPMPDPTVTVTANSRFQLPGVPETFSNEFEAYILGKITEINNIDTFVKEKKPHFSVSVIVPGYIFGRDELVLDAKAAVEKRSSPGILLRSLTGVDSPAPIHGGYVHIDDLAEIYLRVLKLESSTESVSNFGACKLCNYDDSWALVEKNFPKEIADGVLTRAILPTLPISYDSSGTEKALEGFNFRSFEDGVKDVVQFYLDRLAEQN
ncbi:hypothetical protein N7478_009254 [Penicillium angulare]|uniref:uncharacterized protein n=1 Tax=Penicillium angulare TaxID=116970 RepID=UPI00253F6E5A|nr:uncharacterized protein N7478_009254 [Penicillium angulare]KAJ5274129.1 hypothetical protein N7478_009254 [Penicillium angulare]